MLDEFFARIRTPGGKKRRSVSGMVYMDVPYPDVPGPRIAAPSK
jgi:hypothetical protein